MLVQITCDCSVADKCPQGRIGGGDRCRMMVEENRLPSVSIRARDKLWCQALVEVLPIEYMSKLLQRFNELRDGSKTT